MTEPTPANESAGAAAERVPLQWAVGVPVDIARSELLDLHRLLIEEYRFLVKLNSDRAQNYLTLNSAIVTVVAGLLRFADVSARPLMAAICVVGIVIARIGAKGVEQGHRYYRTIVYKKTLVENLLGRHHQISGYAHESATLAVETTLGMADARDILQNTTAYFARGISSNKITGGLIRIFHLFVLVDAFAIGLIVAMTVLERI